MQLFDDKDHQEQNCSCNQDQNISLCYRELLWSRGSLPKGNIHKSIFYCYFMYCSFTTDTNLVSVKLSMRSACQAGSQHNLGLAFLLKHSIPWSLFALVAHASNWIGFLTWHALIAVRRPAALQARVTRRLSPLAAWHERGCQNDFARRD